MLKEVQIGPHRVRVGENDWRDDTFGDSDYKTNSIRLDRDLEPSQMVETMFHEITHLLLWQVPLSLENDEIVASIIGKGPASFVRDNPAWVRRFLKIFKEEDNKCQMK